MRSHQSSSSPPDDQRQAAGGGRVWRRLWSKRHPDWMTRDVRLVILARVFMSGTRALAGIITPIYLAKIGLSAVRLGQLFVVVAVTSALMSALVGLLADRIGRKPFLIIFPILAAIAGLGFVFTRSVPLLFVFGALGAFGRGAGAGGGSIGPYQPAEQAMLADAVPAASRNMLFGVVAFASSLGALIGGGPLAAIPDLFGRIGGARFQGVDAYRPAFLVIFVLALTAGLLVVPIANPRPGRRRAASGDAGRRWRPRFHLSPDSRWLLRRLVVANCVNGLAVGFFGPFLTYWFYRRYGVGPGTIGALYAIVNLTAMASNLGAARVARRFGLVRAVLVTRLLQGALLIPMVLMPTFWMAGGIYLIRMLASRLGMPLRQSYIMAVAPAAERGTVGALANLPSQGTSAISPGLAGYMFEHGSLAMPFEAGAILQMTNAVLFYVFFKDHLPPEELSTGEALPVAAGEPPPSQPPPAKPIRAPDHQPAHDD